MLYEWVQIITKPEPYQLRLKTYFGRSADSPMMTSILLINQQPTICLADNWDPWEHGVCATLKTYHLPGTIRTVIWAFIRCCQLDAVVSVVVIAGPPRSVIFSHISWKLNNADLLRLVSSALNVVVIWAIVTCLLTQTIPVRRLWLRSLRRSSQLLRSQRWAIMTSIRQIRFTRDTVILRLSNILTITEMECSIDLPPTIIPRLISYNSRYLSMSNFSGFHIDSPTDVDLGIPIPAR